MPPTSQRVKVMISSSVYGAQSLLRQTYATLRGFGYEVTCSPIGTLAVNPRVSNLGNCLQAVEECDVFVGFIRPIYGSGRDSQTDKSVSHLELEKAVELNRPRWMLAHSSVVKMRSLVRKVFFDQHGVRNANEFHPLRGEFDDLRVIEMYELATAVHGGSPWSQRVNHWVQEYHYDFEALDFISTQFGDRDRVVANLVSPSE